MFEEINEAFESKEYQKVENLLLEIEEEGQDNPWFQYYQAYLEESKNNLTKAEEIYLKILKNSLNPNPQLFSKIRNGIDRIKKTRAKQKEKKIKEFQEITETEELGVLILKPIPTENKKVAAQKMAKIIDTNVYSAKMLIPSRSLKFYRTGKLAELKYYESQFNKASIPCFCVNLRAINSIIIYQVKYIKSSNQNLIFVCQNNSQKEEVILIKWSDINNRIKALLPLFDSVVEIGRKGKSTRKTTTIDYAEFFDLHINNQNLILRLNDQTYEFDKGIDLPVEENTTKNKWMKLSKFFEKNIPNIKVWSDFTLFGEGVIGFPQMLKQINSNVDLFRREESVWDASFQLYSGSIFLQDK